MNWNVDPNHSQVSFSAKHMGIFTVRGRFEQFEIDLDFNEQAPEKSSVTARIDAGSLTTNQGQRDAHLKSPDFLDIENYPEILFESTRVEILAENSGKVYGNLTIRGDVRPVVLDVKYTGEVKSPWGNTSAGFIASTKINRTDWGLTWNQALETGGVLVGEEITISLELEAIREEAREKAFSAN